MATTTVESEEARQRAVRAREVLRHYEDWNRLWVRVRELPTEEREDVMRMAGEAVEARKLGQRRATVDAARPVTHERDEREGCRVRLSEEVTAKLDELAEWHQESRSSIVAGLIENLYKMTATVIDIHRRNR